MIDNIGQEISNNFFNFWANVWAGNHVNSIITWDPCTFRNSLIEPKLYWKTFQCFHDKIHILENITGNIIVTTKTIWNKR